jgi:hypothetical protein
LHAGGGAVAIFGFDIFAAETAAVMMRSHSGRLTQHAPMPDNVQHDLDRQQGHARRDQAIGEFDRELMLDDQGGETRDHQQKCQTNEGRGEPVTMAGKAAMTVEMMLVQAVMEVMMPAPLRSVFVQREILADTDSEFAHESPW